jgi:hypothetical protein
MSFETLYDRLCRLVKNQTIGEYLHLPDEVKLSEPQTEDYLGQQVKCLIVTFNVTRPFPYEQMRLLDVSEETNDMIYSFLGARICAQFKIRYPKEYPFQSPFWIMHSLKTNVRDSERLQAYFQTCVNVHNDVYCNDWSPGFSFDKDLFYFYLRLTKRGGPLLD